MNASNDGSESVDQFLARIASVKQGRDEANEARTRQIEDEILKGRQERQARRLERARSISPSKTGPAKILSSLSSKSASQSTTDLVVNPPVDFSPQPQNISQQAQPLSRSNAVSGRTSPTKELEPPPSRPLPSPSAAKDVSGTPPTATGLARSGTLSWQQRPSSIDGAATRQRPLSGFATVRHPPPQLVENENNEEPSRKDIAASLAQKDPTWFRQTQDRGAGSAAFRKNQVEDVSEPSQATSMRLPGMSQAREPSKSPTPEIRSDRELPRIPVDIDRFKRGTTPDIVALRDSIALEKSQPRSSNTETLAGRPLSLENEGSESSTPSLARSSSALSSNRPVSPTKGLGGFVESAMMRRSDSVNKRWSVKANTGLKRGDSVAGGRPPSLHSRGLSRDIPVRDSTPSSPLAFSRPGSSHGQEQIKPSGVREKSTSVEPVEESPRKPKIAHDTDEKDIDDSLLARSPSRTMDPRRWSPTKSTWLESALQSEPPKPQPLKEELPKWKVDLQRSRSRASRDVSPEKRPQKQESESVTKKPSTFVASTPPVTSESNTAAPLVKVKTEPLADTSKKESQLEADPVMSKISKSLSTDDTPKSPPKIESKDMTELPKKPPSLKPKPQTPPKTDFRAGLKSRTAGPAQTGEAEPEFRAMFGKLKRTTTQNYVAPDELKTNILSGKAALNVTDGPQKTKRVDEFKESILAKKEAMKAAGNKGPQRSESPVKDEAPIPEALARRKTLSKASAPDLNVIRSGAKGTAPILAPKPSVVPKTAESTLTTQSSQKLVASVPVVPAKSAQIVSHESKLAEQKSQPVEKSVSTTAVKDVKIDGTKSENTQPPTFQPVKPISHAKASTDGHSKIMRSDVSTAKPVEQVVPAITQKSELPPGSKLASRLNPNLAAMLSRGSSPRPQPNRDATSDDALKSRNLSSDVNVKDDESSGTLTHMTKARAKGPKRRAPKAEPNTDLKDSTKNATSKSPATTQIVNDSKPTVDQPPRSIKPVDTAKPPITPQKPSMPLRELPQARSIPPERNPLKSWSSDKTNIPEVKSKVESPKPETPKDETLKLEATRTKPAVGNKSPELRKVSNPAGIEERLKASPKPSVTAKPTWSPASKSAKLDNITNETSPQVESPARLVKSSLVPSKARNAEQPPQQEKSTAAGSGPKPGLTQGLGLSLGSGTTIKKPATKPRVQTPPTSNDQKQLGVPPQEIKGIIESYIGQLSKEHEKADFDSQQFLKDAKNKEESIKTMNQTIHEITGDGKKSSMPPQQEHILYEDSMYLITHAYVGPNGAHTSGVYLWCGDRVSDAAREDAQVFCRRDAREHNARLEVVKQGKESSRLIQAIGGILIIRRNKTSALYMLCGRRHLGHVVFDEVEMDANNLCPGYTYLISAQYGQLYLWKGKGAGADEIGSARLIGMDLGLTGEIEEINDGSEPDSFWEVFGSKPQESWSKDWSKRAELNGYPTVMYRIEHERQGLLGNLWGLTRTASPAKGQTSKAKCERMEAFTQSDLDHPAIHVIDAYRSMYVVVTRQCESKGAEFVTALHLAQEFAMLCPATQDRPLLPNCYVIAGNLSKDVRACFRKWSALEAQSIVGKDSICVRLEEAMEALDL